MPALIRRFGEPLLVALALLLYWVMAVSVSPRMGVTADEVVHLTGGYSYWKFNDYRLHPENGTLPMRVAALPLLDMDLKFTPLDHPGWVNSTVNYVGEIFFYQLGNPLAEMLQRGRAAIALFGVLACWLTWRWARGLFGPAAGVLALVLAIFCPALLAHGGLITSDMALTACVLAALSSVWLLLHRVTWLRLLLATLACGACFLAKMSGGIIVPLIAGMLLIRWLRPVPYVLALGRVRWLRRRMAVMVATTAVMVVVGAGSLTLLWANYSFRYDGFNRALSATNGYYFSWDFILDRAPAPWKSDSALSQFSPPHLAPQPDGGMVRLISFMRDHRLLPEAYLWGLAHTYKFSKERPSFFMGDYRRTGWPLFFPVVFLMKTTLAAELLFFTGVVAAVWSQRRRAQPVTAASQRWWLRRPRSLAYRAAPLILFFVAYWILAVRMSLNLGHRHVLPVYPAFYVFAAASVLWLTGRNARLLALAVTLGVALHVGDSLASRPFYLSYFQPLLGGPERAYRYFVDSSLDWGQGLPDLARWLERQKERGDTLPVFLTYFGADSPAARKLDVIRFGDESSDSSLRSFPAQVKGGWFAISATDFSGISLPMRGTWAAPQEELYWQLMQRLGQASAHPPAPDTAAQAQLVGDAQDFELMQFARLRHSLWKREPLQLIGGSLLLFKLTDQEVQRALYAPLSEIDQHP